MEARELRIGNYYDHNGEVKQVTPNTILDVWESERQWCKPIPLTEDELLKFGFENWGEVVCNEFETYKRWVLHNVIYGTSNFEVHIVTSTYGAVECKQILFSIDNNERQFIHETDFVHNLQNCFYMCAGYELPINP